MTTQVHLVDRLTTAHLLIIRSAVYDSMAEIPSSAWKQNFMLNEELQVQNQFGKTP